MSNIQITQTETPNIVVTVDRGVAGVGIESVAIVYQDPTYYLEFTYTNGTTELVPLPVVATGVTSFNTRIGAVTLTSNDVTTALLANSIANSKLVNSSITVNGAVISLGGSVNVGTVTSVAATAGTGISVTGSPITTSGTLVVTNTAPDQVVSLTGAGTTSVSGTYPNFTITSNDSASGTVTSVAATVPSFLNVTGSPITTNGTLAIDYSGTALPIANGGTGATSAAAALTSLGAYPASNPNGYTSNTGTVTNVGGTGTVNGITLTGSVTTSGNLTLGGTLSGVNLATQVTGTLPPANGGTGITSLGAGVATFLGTPTSANLAAAVTNETGSGALVFGTSPTLITPTITGGTVNPTTLQENGSPVVVQTDIGTAPNEIPLNQYLGSMAYQDRTAVNIGGGVATLGTATVTSIQNDTAISNVEPSLMLNFAAVEALDPRISYTRASTATYYNGVTTAVAEQNLLSYSEQFNNALWLTASLITVTANSTVAPDGNTTADTAAANSNGIINAVFRNEITPPIGSTFSVYAKANSVNFFAIAVGAASNVWASFNLSTGTLGSNGAGCTPSIVSVGNGWYRCIVANIGTASNQILLFPKTADVAGNPYSTGSVSIGDSIFLWGAQLEQRSAVSAYTPTTTQPITNYIPVLLTAASGVPRFDHNPISGDSLGFLVEQQSTNLLTYSSQFDNAAWNKVNATITANQIVAPDGTLSGELLTDDATNGGHSLQAPTSTTTVQSYTFTVYAKAYSLSKIMLYGLNADGKGTGFDLSNGTTFTVTGITLSTSSSIVAVGNGWYRCSIVFPGSAVTSNVGGIYTVSGTTFSYAGTGQSVFLWGAQLEALAFPTSYIATVASQVTRAADAASMTGTNFSSWFNNAEGTVYSEFNVPASTAHIATSGVGRFMYMVAGGLVRIFDGTNFATSLAASFNTNVKAATAFASTGMAAVVNGSAVQTSAYDGTISDGNLFIGRNASASTEFANGTIKKLAYYPRRLSNEELQEMTS